MIKIDKDLSDIPNSLTKGNTKSKRLGVIANGYPISNKQSSKKEKEKVKIYDKIFKTKDILDLLDSIYHSKCGFCEEKIYRVNADNLTDNSEKKHSIEHYRPKSKYPWLAYSWDNLLWCCSKCNQSKGNKFKVLNSKVEFDNTFMEKIHNSTEDYNDLEKPKLIHPELEDVSGELTFDTNGKMNSANRRIQCTIATCKLNRPYLKGERKKVLDKFRKKYNARLLEDEQLAEEVILDFLKNSLTNDIEFKAFRQWIENNLEELLSK